MKITSWRMVQSGRAASAFTGEGAKIYPGRWNYRGVPMVYTAGTLSLVALEMLVHLESVEILNRYINLPVRFDERLCRVLSPKDLPKGWAEDPAPFSARDIGSDWVKSKQSAALAVPSAVVQTEMNYLINPNHPDFRKIKIGPAGKFQFDPRLLKQK